MAYPSWCTCWLVAGTFFTHHLAAEETQPVRVDLGLTLSHFQQQSKPEIGGERGERLIEQTEIGTAAFGTHRLHEHLHLGLFSQFDVGTRNSATFAGYDDQGAATTVERTGGSYWEWWLGPLVRAQYHAVFLELGWGALGYRRDDGRTDIPSDSGNTEGAFRTTPSVAWLLALGGAVPITNSVDLALRLEYRVRYYTRRGNRPLFDDSAMGSQNLTPFIGVALH